MDPDKDGGILHIDRHPPEIVRKLNPLIFRELGQSWPGGSVEKRVTSLLRRGVAERCAEYFPNVPKETAVVGCIRCVLCDETALELVVLPDADGDEEVISEYMWDEDEIEVRTQDFPIIAKALDPKFMSNSAAFPKPPPVTELKVLPRIKEEFNCFEEVLSILKYYKQLSNIEDLVLDLEHPYDEGENSRASSLFGNLSRWTSLKVLQVQGLSTWMLMCIQLPDNVKALNLEGFHDNSFVWEEIQNTIVRHTHVVLLGMDAHSLFRLHDLDPDDIEHVVVVDSNDFNNEVFALLNPVERESAETGQQRTYSFLDVLCDGVVLRLPGALVGSSEVLREISDASTPTDTSTPAVDVPLASLLALMVVHASKEQGLLPKLPNELAMEVAAAAHFLNMSSIEDAMLQSIAGDIGAMTSGVMKAHLRITDKRKHR